MRLANKIFTIICDDVREEVGNKFSIMGVYSGRLIFNKLPAILPRLSIIFFFEDIKTEIPDTVTIKVKNPKMPVMEFSTDTPQIKENKDKANMRLVFSLMPYKVETSGDVKVELYWGNEKRPSTTYNFKIELRDPNLTKSRNSKKSVK